MSLFYSILFLIQTYMMRIHMHEAGAKLSMLKKTQQAFENFLYSNHYSTLKRICKIKETLHANSILNWKKKQNSSIRKYFFIHRTQVPAFYCTDLMMKIFRTAMGLTSKIILRTLMRSEFMAELSTLPLNTEMDVCI